jgi:hypothetical protein
MNENEEAQRSLSAATKRKHKDTEDAEKSILDTDLHG